jgi:hypothetical protein
MISNHMQTYTTDGTHLDRGLAEGQDLAEKLGGVLVPGAVLDVVDGRAEVHEGIDRSLADL